MREWTPAVELLAENWELHTKKWLAEDGYNRVAKKGVVEPVDDELFQRVYNLSIAVKYEDKEKQRDNGKRPK